MKLHGNPKSDVTQLAWVTDADAAEMPIADAIGDMFLSDFSRKRAQRVPDQIHIECLIMHKLDHLEKLTAFADKLTEYNDDAHKLFVEHIKKVIQESQWDAHFEDEDSPISRQCTQLIGTGEGFIDASKQLAQSLYDSMTTRKITRGDFVAVVYRHDDETMRRIAIFKLDLETRQIRDVNHVGNQTHINITKNDGVLPTPDSKNFTKCALLTPFNVVDLDGNQKTRFYIQLLDAQAGPHSAGIAAFFYQGFLHTKLEPNARWHTREFLRITGEFITQHDSEVNSNDRESFYDARREVLATTLKSADSVLDIDRFVETALPSYSDLQTELTSGLVRALRLTSTSAEHKARSFGVDANIARPFVHKVILELDHASRLTFTPEAYAKMVKIERDAEGRLYRIVIETVNYRQIEN